MSSLIQKIPPYTVSFEHSPEVDFLLKAIRNFHGKDDLNELDVLSQSSIEWKVVADLAYLNCVSPLLYKTLEQLSDETFPVDVLAGLRTHSQTQMFYNMVRTQHLVSLLEGLSSAGILAIPFKGPVLAYLIYDNLALRKFSDLDLWVSPTDYEATRQWLKNKGFKLHSDLAWECTFIHPETAINVDLHKAVASTQFQFDLSFQVVQARLIPLELSGHSSWQLSPEDLLLVLCVGWCKDSWKRKSRLIQLCDIAELLRTHPDLDWNYLIKQSSALNGKSILLFPLALAKQWLNAPLANEISSLISEDNTLQKLVKHVQKDFWFYRTHGNTGGIDRIDSNSFTYCDHFVYFSLRRDFFSRFIYLVRIIFTPTEKEISSIELPPLLSFFYYPLRLARLLQKYGAFAIKSLRKPGQDRV
jgi:hypothetical protein